MIINLTKLLDVPCRVTILSKEEPWNTVSIADLQDDRTSKKEPYSFELET